MLFRDLKQIYKSTVQHKNPAGFFFSRLLFRLHLSQFIPIKRKGYKIRFFPTIMSKFCYDKVEYFRGDEEKFLERYLREGDVYIDVGANIGLFALKAASIVLDSGTVYAFEPMPKIFACLRSNINFNKFKNVKLYNYGVGDKPGQAFISDHPVDDSVNSILNSGSIGVKLVTLDSLSLYENSINLLKVDVEGYELFVFTGAKTTLEKTDCVFFESWETHFKKYGYGCADVFNILKMSGFKIYKAAGVELIEIKDDYISVDCEDLIAIRDLESFKSRYFHTRR